jgi:hypothetical protein
MKTAIDRKSQFLGMTPSGINYSLTVPYSMYDIHFDTPLSPKNRGEKLLTIRKVQKLLSDATDMLNESGIPQCTSVLGAFEEKQEI